MGIDVEQYAFTGKLGYVFPQHKYKSLGLIFSGNIYNNDSYYGLTKYNGNQKSVYANFIYQSIIGTTDHKFRTGLSFSNDNFNEKFNAANYRRNEIVPGAFSKRTAVGSVNMPLNSDQIFGKCRTVLILRVNSSTTPSVNIPNKSNDLITNCTASNYCPYPVKRP